MNDKKPCDYCEYKNNPEEIAKLKRDIDDLKKKLSEAVEVIIEATPIIKDSFWASSPEEDPQYEFKKEFLRHANTARAFLKENKDELQNN